MAQKFLPSKMTTAAGRKTRPPKKVREIMEDSFCQALDQALQDVVDAERIIRTGMAGKRPPEAVDRDFYHWTELRNQVRELFEELPGYVGAQHVEQYRCLIEKISPMFEQLPKDVRAYCKGAKASKGDQVMLSELKRQTTQLEIEINRIHQEISQTLSSLSVNPPTSNGVISSTPKPGPEHRNEQQCPRFPEEPSIIPSTILVTTANPTENLNTTQSIDTAAQSLESHEPVSTPPEPETSDTLTKLVDLLESRHNIDRLPYAEPDIFKGDLLSFSTWWSAFETMVESRARTDKDKLFYLHKYTGGHARESIQGFLNLYHDPTAYQQAKSIIFNRFGDKIKIAEAYRSRLAKWSRIKEGDGTSMLKYSDFLWQCYSAMGTLTYLSNLNSQEENVKMATKLPQSVLSRWNRVVDKTLYSGRSTDQPWNAPSTNEYPDFKQFCKFVSEEARVANGPCSTSDVHRDNRDIKKHTNFGTSVTQNNAPQTPNKPKCPFCKKDHYLYKCVDFLKNTPDFKKNYAKEKGLCFGCLRRNHRYQECRIKNKALMKEFQAGEQPSALALHVNTGSSALYTMVVPIWIWLDNREHRLLTYAVIDSQSDCCFMTEELAYNLQAPSETVQLNLVTLGSKRVISSKRVEGIVIQGEDQTEEIRLTKCYTRNDLPINRECLPDPEVVKSCPHLATVADSLKPLREDLNIGLLIGYNCPRALLPLECIHAPETEIFGVRTPLGWTVIGKPEHTDSKPETYNCYKTTAKEINHDEIRKAFDLEFVNADKTEERKMSSDDMKFLRIVEQGIRLDDDGHFELPLPMKYKPTDLPDSRPYAIKCLMYVKKRMERDTNYGEMYRAFMKNLLDSGQAELVPSSDKTPTGETWYWSHHGVKHPRKPDKVRCVFNGSAAIQGVALNEILLTGPDLLNNLVGVFCRFRKERIPITCDVEGMFHQVRVTEEHRNFIRFLWFKNGDTNDIIQDFRMKVHLFGASSSPGCANYALKETAKRFGSTYGEEAAEFVASDFYVDDGLTSVAEESQAVELINNSHNLCKAGGFNLHKFTCGSREVLSKINPELISKTMTVKEMAPDNVANEKALGVEISLTDDTLRYNVTLLKKPNTRRGYLSALSSVYDPLGLIAPALLKGRQLLQSLCSQKFGWDEELPPDLNQQWQEWYTSLESLKEIKVNRSVKETVEGEISCELHIFCDASTTGYGACGYLLLQDAHGNADVSLMYAKSRVAPSKKVTIPRLELQAAVLAVKMGTFLEKELQYEKLTIRYWTDSMVVLGYILNEARRFHVYVANRTEFIRSLTEPEQWGHIATEDNPADIASRGIHPPDLATSKLWWKGPDGLETLTNRATPVNPKIDNSDPELRKEPTVLATATEPDTQILKFMSSQNSWNDAVLAICVCLAFLRHLKSYGLEYSTLKRDTEDAIIRAAQQKWFPEEIKTLSQGPQNYENRRIAKDRNMRLKQTSNLYRLDPFVDDRGLLRTGGRLKRADLTPEEKHPIIMPSCDPVTKLIIQHCHLQAKHAGSNWTLAYSRQLGYWILNGRSAVNSYVRKCVTCKRYRAPFQTQKMSDLPRERLEAAAPFTHSAVDLFGPFLVKVGRSRCKRWGCIFVCLCSRAIHLEVVDTLDVSSFINAYRRFCGRRGPVVSLRCDQGTNFIGANNELNKEADYIPQDELERKLKNHGCELIKYRFNPPKASHMAGSWERMIRTVRNAICYTLVQHGENLSDEVLRTLLVEAEAVVNSRPISYLTTDDPTQPQPLSPAQILNLKPRISPPPPGNFSTLERYSVKRWRYVQYLAEQFWLRWRKEVLPGLNTRVKWQKPQENLKYGDVVILHEEGASRGDWPLGVINDVHPSEDGLVRKVTVRARGSLYQRPIHKLVKLFSPDDEGDD